MFEVKLPVLESIINNNPNLHHLEFSCICENGVNFIANNCPQLTHIGIGRWTGFCEDSIRKLVSNCPKLKYAKFEQTSFSDTALYMMSSQTCPDLEYLQITGCHDISKEALQRFVSPATAANLKHLRLSSSPLFSWFFIKDINQNLPNLNIVIDRRIYLQL